LGDRTLGGYRSRRGGCGRCWFCGFDIAGECWISFNGEAGDGSRFSCVEDLEVFLGEVIYGVAMLIADHYGQKKNVDLGLDCREWGRLRSGLRTVSERRLLRDPSMQEEAHET
jgi:hypothetical protein